MSCYQPNSINRTKWKDIHLGFVDIRRCKEEHFWSWTEKYLVWRQRECFTEVQETVLCHDSCVCLTVRRKRNVLSVKIINKRVKVKEQGWNSSCQMLGTTGKKALSGKLVPGRWGWGAGGPCQALLWFLGECVNYPFLQPGGTQNSSWHWWGKLGSTPPPENRLQQKK